MLHVIFANTYVSIVCNEAIFTGDDQVILLHKFVHIEITKYELMNP